MRDGDARSPPSEAAVPSAEASCFWIHLKPHAPEGTSRAFCGRLDGFSFGFIHPAAAPTVTSSGATLETSCEDPLRESGLLTLRPQAIPLCALGHGGM